LADPYGQIASDWAWSIFDRAVGAHMRGDDRLALSDARQLTRLRPALEPAARAHGWGPTPGGSSSGVAPLFYFLGPLPALLADQERRVIHPKAERAILAEDEAQADHVFSDNPLAANPWLARFRSRHPDPAERVEALIRDLDEVQWRGEPGFAADPVMQALVAEGPAAVGPLLDCIENDPRLTRSVSFAEDRGEFVGLSLISVKGAAKAALDQILKTRGTGLQIRFKGDPSLPAAGAEIPVRMKDFYTEQISEELEGSPTFALYWPESKRDEAIARLIRLLETAKIVTRTSS
jgi:hypothetical protein